MMTNDHKDRQIALMGELIREYALQLNIAHAKITELENLLKQYEIDTDEGEEL